MIIIKIAAYDKRWKPKYIILDNVDTIEVNNIGLVEFKFGTVKQSYRIDLDDLMDRINYRVANGFNGLIEAKLLDE